VATGSGFPWQCGAKPRLFEALAQPVNAALGTGPPETCWLEALRPLAAATHGLARLAGAAQLLQRLAIIGAAAHGGMLRCCPGYRRTAFA